MTEPEIISYPTYISEVSIYIGRLRDLFNASMNNQAPEYKRGDRSESVNVLGVFGELVFAQYLHQKGLTEFEQAELLQPSPVIAPDFIVNGLRIDVKTIRPDAPDLLVNVDAHLKKSDIDRYVFIQDNNDSTAKMWSFGYNTVSKWPVKNVRYSNAHFKKII